MQKRHTITNDTNGRLVVFTEPEGMDYWLLPGESLDVMAEAAAPEDEFRLVRLPEGYQVWPAPKMGYISAWRGEEQLPCGYQRPQVEPVRQWQFHEYLQLLDTGVATAEPSPDLVRAALGQAEVLWPKLKIGVWSAVKQRVESLSVCGSGERLVHVRANRKNCFLILMVPPETLRASGYLLLDIGAEQGDIRFDCPEFDIDRPVSKADIYQYIPRLPGKSNPFAILELAPGTFMQAYAGDDELFEVEYQLVSTAAHFLLTERVNAHTVIQLFLSYAYGKHEWAREYAWQKMELG
jgi:hypothetical protein